MYKTFREIIKCWDTYQALATDIGEPYLTVRQWHTRDRIPSRAWPRIADAAKARRLNGITVETLADLNAEYSLRERAA